MAKTSFWTELRNAAISRIRVKENPAWRAIFNAFGASRGPAWKTVDLKNFIEEGYQKCWTVFACVSLIAKSASRIAWTLKQGKKELDTHELLTKLARPNEYESGIRFTEKVFSFWRLAGNSYIYRNSGIDSAPPTNLYALRPDRMTINKSGGWRNPIESYDYSAGAKPETFKPQLILHMTEFHPLDDWYGLSPIQVAARQVDISNESAKWNMASLQNSMRTPGVLMSKGIIDLEKLKEMFRENYQGAKRVDVPLVFEGEDLKWEPLAMSPKDMDWIVGRKMTMREICAIFGVPSMLLGDTEATTYANYQEARTALYMETVLPLMDIYREELNSWLVPLYGSGLRLDYDRDAIEAIQEDRGQKYAYLSAANFLTLNEKRVATGYDEIVGGDVILVPISNVPLAEAIAEPEPAPDFAPADDEDTPDDETTPDDAQKVNKSVKYPYRVIKAVKKSFWTDPERSKALWTNFEKRTRTREKSFTELAKSYMRAQGERVQQRLAQIGSLPMRAEDLLDADAETKEYVKKFWAWYKDHFIRAGYAGAQAAKGELFDDSEFKADAPKPTSWVFTMTPEQEAKLRTHIFNTGSEINDTTIEKIYQQLKQAQTTNMTVDEFARALVDKIEDLARWRARLWAQNESAWTDNYGQNEAFKGIEEVDRKGWLSSFLLTSRDDHMNASGQEVGKNESFQIGSYMQEFPGDGSQGAPIEDTIQCKCSIYAVVGEG